MHSFWECIELLFSPLRSLIIVLLMIADYISLYNLLSIVFLCLEFSCTITNLVGFSNWLVVCPGIHYLCSYIFGELGMMLKGAMLTRSRCYVGWTCYIKEGGSEFMFLCYMGERGYVRRNYDFLTFLSSFFLAHRSTRSF